MNNCIVCEKSVELEERYNLLYDAVRFTATGNYGSRVYDPNSKKQYLEMYVCDKCLVEKQNLIKEVHYTEKKVVTRCCKPEFGELAQNDTSL